MVHSEEIDITALHLNFAKLRQLLVATNDDALIAFWGPEADIPTALETIEERCKMAFEGIPPETRKSLEDGTTIFERVLPGADRMYPDTDSAPIAVEEEHLEALRKKLPTDLHLRINQLKQWEVPQSCHLFLLRNNLVGVVERIAGLGYNPRTVALLIAQQFKHLVSARLAQMADTEKIFNLMKYLKEQKLEVELTAVLLHSLFTHPDKSPEELLQLIGFTKSTPETLTQKVTNYATEFAHVGRKKQLVAAEKWVMGQLRHLAIGNMPMAELQKAVAATISKQHQLN
jgi:Archaeal Glu-tRNAGln amidotransferase subunit E (contains GAD domain)